MVVVHPPASGGDRRAGVVGDWMVEGIPNLEVIARPGRVAKLRSVLGVPGEHPVMSAVDGGPGMAMAGMLVVEAP